jgi:DNA-binding NarL/FixJ family response regulator
MFRVAIVAASPLLGEGVKAALAAEAAWRVLAPVPQVEDIDANADAVVAVAGHAHEAVSLYQVLAGRVPLVLMGDAPPSRGSGEMPVALLPLAASAQQLRAALQAVLAGLHAWSPEFGSSLHAATGSEGELPGEPLTPRELEVLELLAKGLSNRDIAGVLGISAHTAKFHVAQILAKIGAATRAEAVRLSIQSGLIGV